MSESPGPLVSVGARHPWLCLWGGAVASFLSVGGRFDVPLAAWAAPLLLIRFLRHTRLLRAGVRRWPGQVTDTARTMTRTPYGGDPGSGSGPRAAVWPPHGARPVHRSPCHAADLRE